MKLDEFLATTQATLAAFSEATRENAKTDATFDSDRTDADWWREVAAYAEYVELDESSRRVG